jgi:triosephosphate isomerase
LPSRFGWLGDRTASGRLVDLSSGHLNVQSGAGGGWCIAIGGEDCHAEISGAFTGDISAEMLKDAGAATVIVGHPERRKYHGENDAMVAAKANAACRSGLFTTVCIGETRAQHHAGNTLAVCDEQIAGSLPPDVAPSGTAAIAYEPLWAIGIGHIPRPIRSPKCITTFGNA